MSIDLRGRVIAISGAGTGIGRAAAIAVAQRGMHVALAGRRADKVAEVAQQVRGVGVKALAMACDVAQPAQCEAFIDAAERELGPVYAVFANAGYGVEKPTYAMSDGDIREMFETNFFGSLNFIRPALDRMLARDQAQSPPRGHVLWCSSCLSKLGMPFYACYSATKACQDHFARGMRLELASRGVFVSSVHPVGTRTDFFDTAASLSGGRLRAMGNESPRSARFTQPPETVARAIVRCLERPRGEVWTSVSARLGFALADLWPELTDRALAIALRKRFQAAESQAK
ncbi:MAG: SDR family oxidoreductase [Planctomycetota bacterium]|nr:SDR family oxidoreductase [Planctomycetota bacterium]